MSESTANLRENFLKRKEVFESKRLKVNLKKTKVIVSFWKEKIIKSKIDPCAKCGQMVISKCSAVHKMSQMSAW